MKKKKEGRKVSDARSDRRRKVFLEIAGAILIAGALFWGLFYINTVEVVGNSGKNYTDQQILEMTIPEFWTKNSVLLRIFRHRVELKDIRFMDSVEVEFRSRNEIRLHVNEKKPVGFVRINNKDYYFDHEGIVLEIMSAEETQQLKQTAMETAMMEQQMEANPPEGGEGLPAEEEDTDHVQEFNPSLADVPMITGLNVPEMDPGLRLPLDNPTFFNTIQFLTKMIDKYGIQPDYVEISENTKAEREMTLYYGSVRAALGTDSELEEKVTRLAAILPKLQGRSGILHLEEYTSETINIVFDADM
ncbi:MAG: hypothetical protein MJ117_03710 [Lachnospiraceae bacterium]|nr:hypothetical protein [Lachnospiraceae bacterium]